MDSICVCYSTSSSLISRLIRWFSRSEASHALLTFHDPFLEKVFVMEANGRGFMLTPWAKWRRTHKLLARFSVKMPPSNQVVSLKLLAEHLGSQYDYISLLGFLFRRWVKRVANPFSDPDRLVCSEAVAVFLRDCGIGDFDKPETWTPGDLLTWMRKRPQEYQLEEGK